jgi:hypothetical protein
MNGTGNSVDLTLTQEEAAKQYVLEILKVVAKEIRAHERYAIAMRLLNTAKNPDAFLSAIQAEIKGSWVDNLILGASAISGLILGTISSRITAPLKRANIGRFPLISLAGLAGIIPGFALKDTLTARNSLGLGGLMFSAGALVEGYRRS